MKSDRIAFYQRASIKVNSRSLALFSFLIYFSLTRCYIIFTGAFLSFKVSTGQVANSYSLYTPFFGFCNTVSVTSVGDCPSTSALYDSVLSCLCFSLAVKSTVVLCFGEFCVNFIEAICLLCCIKFLTSFISNPLPEACSLKALIVNSTDKS